MTDDTTITRSQSQMQKAALALAAMADELALAKQVKEYNGDRMKRALSERVVVYLGRGESATAAEHHARADELYGVSVDALGLQYEDAMKVIEQAEAQRILWESARSLLSVEKAKLNLI